MIDFFGPRPNAQRMMPLIFVVDSSSSMHDQRIDQVNTAIRDILDDVEYISEINRNADMKVNLLSFGNTATWMSDTMLSPQAFIDRFDDIKAMGVTNFKEACEQLNAKLSPEGFMTSTYGLRYPAIVLLSDGAPTDAFGHPSNDYKASLAKLRQNKWIKEGACLIAIGIGDRADFGMLAEFTGSPDYVYHVNDVNVLKNTIQVLTALASRSASRGDAIPSGGIEEFKPVSR